MALFIINGTERVIVNQLHRSPGIFFDHDKGKIVASGKLFIQRELFPSEVPGWTWNLILKTSFMSRIDRRRKMPVTILLKALGNATDLF